MNHDSFSFQTARLPCRASFDLSIGFPVRGVKRRTRRIFGQHVRFATVSPLFPVRTDKAPGPCRDPGRLFFSHFSGNISRRNIFRRPAVRHYCTTFRRFRQLPRRDSIPAIVIAEQSEPRGKVLSGRQEMPVQLPRATSDFSFYLHSAFSFRSTSSFLATI